MLSKIIKNIEADADRILKPTGQHLLMLYTHSETQSTPQQRISVEVPDDLPNVGLTVDNPCMMETNATSRADEIILILPVCIAIDGTRACEQNSGRRKSYSCSNAASCICQPTRAKIRNDIDVYNSSTRRLLGLL